MLYFQTPTGVIFVCTVIFVILDDMINKTLTNIGFFRVTIFQYQQVEPATQAP